MDSLARPESLDMLLIQINNAIEVSQRCCIVRRYEQNQKDALIVRRFIFRSLRAEFIDDLAHEIKVNVAVLII
jgi:hypothetical protein